MDADGTWGDWFGAIKAVVTAVVVAAMVIAAAPVVATAVATTAVCLGVASAAGTAATIASIGCATVAAATVVCGVNRGVEAVTGMNCGAAVYGEKGYAEIESVVLFSATLISIAPNYFPYPSTGNTTPSNLKEQMKYRYAVKYRGERKVIIRYLHDKRMPGWLGWQKYLVKPTDGVEIHYVGNRYLPIRFDYKFK